MTPLAIAMKSREALLDKKAQDVVVLDVSRFSGVTDFFVIATGTNAPHLKAMLEEVSRKLKKEGASSYRRSADAESPWLVLDYVDVVIHIFSPEAREYYAIEALWADAARID